MTAAAEVQLAHDLRTPLSSVLVIAELLEQGRFGALTPPQLEQVRVLHAAVRSLCDVTDDALALARAGEAAAGPREPFAMSALLARVRDVARPMAAARGLALRIECGVDGVRLGHPRAVERVLLNLVTNAVKFTARGWVDVSAAGAGARDAPDTRDAMRVTVSVRDSGPGLGKADGGTGMGLPACRRLLAMMGSALRLESAEGAGTRFHFDLDLPHARD